MTALKHASLVGQDLAGLTAGRSVLWTGLEGLVTFSCRGDDDDLICSIDGTTSWTDRASVFVYIGELADDGFITCPEGGWRGNPVGGDVVCRTKFGDLFSSTDDVQWPHDAHPGHVLNVIAFRPTPAGDLGALQPQGASVSTEKTDGPAAHREWRCFQCDDLFTSHEEAALHFGRFEDCTPACKIGAERFRAMETEIHEYRTESDAASKTFYSLGADHRTALIRAEQEGYDKGLADGRAEAAPVPASQVGMEAEGRNASKAPPKYPAGEVERLRVVSDPVDQSGEAVPTLAELETFAVARLIAFANAVEGQGRSLRMVLACEEAKATAKAIAALYAAPVPTGGVSDVLRDFVDQARVGDGSRPVARSKRVNVPAALFHRAVVALKGASNADDKAKS